MNLENYIKIEINQIISKNYFLVGHNFEIQLELIGN